MDIIVVGGAHESQHGALAEAEREGLDGYLVSAWQSRFKPGTSYLAILSLHHHAIR